MFPIDHWRWSACFHHTVPCSPDLTLSPSLEMGHEACALVFVVTQNHRPWEPPHKCLGCHESPPALEDSQDASEKEQVCWMCLHVRRR